LANALILVGIATVIWGVFTFQQWVFAGAGPALVGAGVLASVATNRQRSLP
jgi:hypothetical protein